MIMGGSIKRSKRTLANIERKFTIPFINKAAWRMMQFAPDRYPVQDLTFNVSSTLGIVARELEQQSLGNMMKTVPADSPAFWMLLKGIFEHSVTSNREEMLQIIEQMMQESLKNKQNPKPDPLVMVKMKEIELKAQLAKAEMKLENDQFNKEFQLDVQRFKLEVEKAQTLKKQIYLDAQIAIAGQEQDSLVTAVQMQGAEKADLRKTAVALRKGNRR